MNMTQSRQKVHQRLRIPFGLQYMYFQFQIPKDMFAQYCWTHGTYTREEFLVYDNRSHSTHPGIGIKKWNTETRQIYHKYYQWVPFLLLLDAFLSYIPRLMWKSLLEGNYMKNLCGGFHRYDVSVSITFYGTASA